MTQHCHDLKLVLQFPQTLTTGQSSNAKATFVQITMTQISRKPSKPSHVGIHWIALTEYSQMSTHLQGFWSFFRFLHHFVLDKLATSSIRVNTTKNVEVNEMAKSIIITGLL